MGIDPDNFRRAIAIALVWILALMYASHLRMSLDALHGWLAYSLIASAAAFISSKIEIQRPAPNEA